MPPGERQSTGAPTGLRIASVVIVASLALPATLAAAPGEPSPSDGASVAAEQPSPAPVAAQPSPPPDTPAGEEHESDPAPPDESRPLPERDRSAAAADPVDEAAPRAEAAAAKAASVSVVGDTFASFGYSPKTVTVDEGEVVRWHNSSGVSEGHTVTGDGFDSGVFHEGEDYSHRFNRAGNFSYLCTLHPSMKGKVSVLASSGGGERGGGSSSEGGGSSGASGSGGGGSSGSAPGSSTGDPAGSGQLPSTGMPLLPLVAAGVGFLLLGALLSRLEFY